MHSSNYERAKFYIINIFYLNLTVKFKNQMSNILLLVITCLVTNFRAVSSKGFIQVLSVKKALMNEKTFHICWPETEKLFIPQTSQRGEKLNGMSWNRIDPLDSHFKQFWLNICLKKKNSVQKLKIHIYIHFYFMIQ